MMEDPRFGSDVLHFSALSRDVKIEACSLRHAQNFQLKHLALNPTPRTIFAWRIPKTTRRPRSFRHKEVWEGSLVSGRTD